MALIIEDGTQVSNANSYITLAEARAYAVLRGITLPVDDVAVEASIVQSFDYTQSFESRYQGTRTAAATQPAAFPREGVVLYGSDIDGDVIPKTLKDAQSQLVIEAQSFSLQPSSNGKFITKEKVDVLEVSYATPSSGSPQVAQPDFPAVDSLLEPLFKSSVTGLASALTTVRI
jgi:hypothetical protein